MAEIVAQDIAVSAEVTSGQAASITPQVTDVAKSFTQEQVDRIVNDRLTRDRDVRKQAKAQPAPKAEDRDLAKELEELRGLREQDQRDRQFTEAAADKGIAKPLRELLRSAYEHEKPPEIGAWIDSKVSALGQFAQGPPKGQAQTLTPAQAQTIGQALSSEGAARRVPDVEREIDLFKLTDDDIATMGTAKLAELYQNFVGKHMGIGTPNWRKKAPGMKG